MNDQKIDYTIKEIVFGTDNTSLGTSSNFPTSGYNCISLGKSKSKNQSNDY